MTRFHPTRILCPTDVSDLSRIAVRCGLAWARRFGAKLFVISARELTLPLLRANDNEVNPFRRAWIEPDEGKGQAPSSSLDGGHRAKIPMGLGILVRDGEARIREGAAGLQLALPEVESATAQVSRLEGR